MSASRHGLPVRRRTHQGVLCLGACLFSLLLNGCRHKQAPPTLPAILKSPDIQPPIPASPEMEGAPPESISNAPPPVKVTEAKPKRRTKKASAKLTEATPASAAPSVSPTPAEVSHIGALTAGGESNPQNQQEASDLLASTGRRLEALLKAKGGKPEGQLLDQTREVRRFLQQAREALGTGDAEGAKTLATKAKLLMDDLEKWAQQ